MERSQIGSGATTIERAAIFRRSPSSAPTPSAPYGAVNSIANVAASSAANDRCPLHRGAG